MCDHCVKRERAYVAATPDVRDAVDRLTAQIGAEMSTAMILGTPPQEFETRYLQYGDDMDILLGLLPGTVPDEIPPEWL